MQSAAFQHNKVKRLINTQGEWFVFKQEGKNDFGEPNGVAISTITFKGLYHETTSYLQKSATEGSTVRKKPSPMILCLWTNAKLLSHDYVLTYSGKRYKIGEIKNLSEANVAADISIEEIQDG